MASDPEESALDRSMSCLFGGLTGSAYGLVLALAIAFFTEQWHPNIIGWSAAVFAFLGFFYGNLIAEAFLALMHFLWGLINGLSDNWRPIEEHNSYGYLRVFLLLGFGTGLVLIFWWLWGGLLTILYGLPRKARKLIDRSGFLEAHAVVYPASRVGSLWPVPTWNLPTARQSVQPASKLPELLSASIREGATQVAMMGDQSQRKRR